MVTGLVVVRDRGERGIDQRRQRVARSVQRREAKEDLARVRVRVRVGVGVRVGVEIRVREVNEDRRSERQCLDGRAQGRTAIDQDAVVRGQGPYSCHLVIGHWALGIGHWALGIGHWALGLGFDFGLGLE